MRFSAIVTAAPNLEEVLDDVALPWDDQARQRRRCGRSLGRECGCCLLRPTPLLDQMSSTQQLRRPLDEPYDGQYVREAPRTKVDVWRASCALHVEHTSWCALSCAGAPVLSSCTGPTTLAGLAAAPGTFSTAHVRWYTRKWPVCEACEAKASRGRAAHQRCDRVPPRLPSGRCKQALHVVCRNPRVPGEPMGHV